MIFFRRSSLFAAFQQIHVVIPRGFRDDFPESETAGSFRAITGKANVST
jgi:hypothetical protein